MDTSVVRRDADYEITVDGKHAGLAAFVEKDGAVVFTHTEIADAYEGHGIGGQLARAALDDVRARGLKVVPRCPFIKEWIDKHPAYADLIKAHPKLSASGGVRTPPDADNSES